MDEQRDYKEELANAMIPFEENLEMEFGFPEWNMQSLITYATSHPGRVTVENWNGYVVLDLGLKMAPDGSLWRNPDEDF